MSDFFEKKCQLEPVLHYLAEQLSPVIFGSKPSMLIGLHCWDKLQSCPVFFSYQQEILQLFGVKAKVFSQTDVMTQVFFYREDILQKSLSDYLAEKILRDHGYASTSVQEALKELERRFNPVNIPHEIGLFLGYPSKDVAGYIDGDEPVEYIKGPWRVYGDADSSLKLMKRHSVARKAMKLLIQRHKSIFNCMNILYSQRTA